MEVRGRAGFVAMSKLHVVVFFVAKSGRTADCSAGGDLVLGATTIPPPIHIYVLAARAMTDVASSGDSPKNPHGVPRPKTKSSDRRNL